MQGVAAADIIQKQDVRAGQNKFQKPIPVANLYVSQRRYPSYLMCTGWQTCHPKKFRVENGLRYKD